MLSDLEKNQFSRQLRLPGFGEAQQQLLKNAHVLIIGMGGLGNPVAAYLAAAGIGKLTLVDFDCVELHNIHRQLLFGAEDCGKFKAEAAAIKLKNLYPELLVDFRLARFNETDPDAIPAEVCMIADCTDNIAARYGIDERASALKIPVMFGAVHRTEGQISLFHATSGTRYSDIYPSPPTSSLGGSCEEEGVLGPVAGIIGSMMATSIIQYIAIGNCRADGRLIRYDGLLHETLSVQIAPESRRMNSTHIHAIELSEFNTMIQTNTSLDIIDVREGFEHEEYNIGGICLPAGDLNQWLNNLIDGRSVFLYCNHGVQSYAVARILAQKRPGLQIYHLKDGLQGNLLTEQCISISNP
jgi:adenylyltransferase/sulfurtransferase